MPLIVLLCNGVLKNEWLFFDFIIFKIFRTRRISMSFANGSRQSLPGTRHGWQPRQGSARSQDSRDTDPPPPWAPRRPETPERPRPFPPSPAAPGSGACALCRPTECPPTHSPGHAPRQVSREVGAREDGGAVRELHAVRFGSQ